MYTMKEYHSGKKCWAVYAPGGELVCVCLYKRGAVEVLRHLNHQQQT